MAAMNETPINYRLTDTSEPCTIEITVEGGENILDLVAHDGTDTAAIRLDIAEALELIASLTRAIAVAVGNA
jgi:hypothetical protein